MLFLHNNDNKNILYPICSRHLGQPAMCKRTWKEVNSLRDTWNILSVSEHYLRIFELLTL